LADKKRGLNVLTRKSVRRQLRPNMDPRKRRELDRKYWSDVNCPPGCGEIPGDWSLPKDKP